MINSYGCLMGYNLRWLLNFPELLLHSQILMNIKYAKMSWTSAARVFSCSLPRVNNMFFDLTSTRSAIAKIKQLAHDFLWQKFYFHVKEKQLIYPNIQFYKLVQKGWNRSCKLYSTNFIKFYWLLFVLSGIKSHFKFIQDTFSKAGETKHTTHIFNS